MKKVPILLVLLLVIFFILKSTSSRSTIPPVIDETDTEETILPEGLVPTDSEPTIPTEIEAGTVFTIIYGSTVSYVAQKQFLEKDTKVITGTTSGVTGAVSLHDNSTLSGEARIDLSTLTTDNDSRDKDVATYFNGPAVITIPLQSIPLINGISPTITTLTTEITINDILQTIPFEVELVFTDNLLRASGRGSITLPQFGIEAPSLASVYSVADNLELEFSLVANTSN
ncbi:MAG: polyisoprenoid-binding protein YceI [Planctomycetota bacterium]|jgi:polyisoprenoid-binding protein YceI